MLIRALPRAVTAYTIMNSAAHAHRFSQLKSHRPSLLIVAWLPYRLVFATLLVVGAGCQQRSALVNLPPPPAIAIAPQEIQLSDFAEPQFEPVDVVRPVYPTPAPKQVEPPAPVARRPASEPGWMPSRPSNRWKYIVIHHSATHSGSANEFDRSHRNRGWDELGYHFVIGNGDGSGNGIVEVGSRWRSQKHGAHIRINPNDDNWHNQHSIGICLVGNFDSSRATARQMQSLTRLVRFLQVEFHISSNRIVGHGDLMKTACPGRNFKLADLRRRLNQSRSLARR